MQISEVTVISEELQTLCDVMQPLQIAPLSLLGPEHETHIFNFIIHMFILFVKADLLLRTCVLGEG